MKTKAGLKIFSRDRCGLRSPRRALANRGQLRGASFHHGGAIGAPRYRFAHAAATWREFQRFHQDVRGWLDIAYTFGIDGFGRLYAGRPVDKLPAAVENHNTGTITFVFLQDGDRYRLTPLQRRTLKILFEKGIPERGIPPLKTVDCRGHQEYPGHYSNACPGQHIMRHLRWRRLRSRTR